MNRKTAFILLLCTTLISSITVSAQKAYWAFPEDSVALKLIAMDKMWADANCSPQTGLEEVFADDFMGTAIDGFRYGKKEAMALISKPDRQCQFGTVKVHFFGDKLAIAYGNESSIRMDAAGKEYKRCLAWTDTWLKRDGKWQLIAAQDNVVECSK
ncbi:MAG TPA: nuclear transport factor 2 family protein [Bacteroidales bacterium]|nr:nuclear transport factor 2 family protein [Bacteroidales bacterium]